MGDSCIMHGPVWLNGRAVPFYQPGCILNMVRPRPIWLSLLILRSNTFWWVWVVCNSSLGQHGHDPILLVYGNAQTSSNMSWLVANVLNNRQYTKVEYFENLLAGQTLEYKTSPFYIKQSIYPWRIDSILSLEGGDTEGVRCIYLHIFKPSLQFRWIAS